MHKKPFVERGALGKMKKAYRIVQQAHAGQYRKGPEEEPFYKHPRRVCKTYLQFHHKNLDGALAALCHDLVEDTRMEPDEIEALFGSRVREFVADLTKPAGMGHQDYLQYFEDWPLESKKVKVCDIEDNILGSRSIPAGRRQEMMRKWSRYLDALSPNAENTGADMAEYRIKWDGVRDLLEREWNQTLRTALGK